LRADHDTYPHRGPTTAEASLTDAEENLVAFKEGIKLGNSILHRSRSSRSFDNLFDPCVVPVNQITSRVRVTLIGSAFDRSEFHGKLVRKAIPIWLVRQLIAALTPVKFLL
jgi:hypothetical protein